MRQSNKCGSGKNGEIINLHLRSVAGPSVSILQDTSHIYWFQNNQPGKNKECRNETQFPTNRIILPWPKYSEPRAKRGRLWTNTMQIFLSLLNYSNEVELPSEI